MVKTIAQMFQQSVNRYPNHTLIGSKNKSGKFVEETYSEVENIVINLALGLQNKFDYKKQELIAIISDNRKEWLYSDLAIQYLNCVDVPRGLDATDVELIQILNETKVSTCFVENVKTIKRFEGLKDDFPFIKTLILMEQTDVEIESDFEVVKLYDLIESGSKLLVNDKSLLDNINSRIEEGKADDLATIIFTSGTTGACKGVMLTNNNFIYEVSNLQQVVDNKFKPGQRWMTVLPIWHSLERAVTYVCLYHNQAMYYSKPISKIMLSDFQKVNPHWFSSVPRIWQSVNKTIESKIRKTKGFKKTLSLVLIKSAKNWKNGYNKVHGLLPKYKKNPFSFIEVISGFISMTLNYPLFKLGNKIMFRKVKSLFGKNLIAGVCGGGSMPKGVDAFFNAIGITLLDGYGMTETAPILSVRNLRKPIIGTMQIIDGTSFKIVDENNKEVSVGEKGVLKVKGPQVMKGYFNNPKATNAIIDKDGYLNTGDLVIKSLNNDISIVGRAKDTIVLAGGENLEPVPIEGKLSELDFIDNVIVIGQDRKYLSALIVVNSETIKEYVASLSDKYKDDKEAIHKYLKEKIDEKINIKLGFKPHELINKFALLEKPFEVGRELSAKQELKRNKIEEYYKKVIDSLYA
ncbi:MAG: AMP-dependent synthetase/ligase [Pleomorphochaeta sp.]